MGMKKLACGTSFKACSASFKACIAKQVLYWRTKMMVRRKIDSNAMQSKQRNRTARGLFVSPVEPRLRMHHVIVRKASASNTASLLLPLFSLPLFSLHHIESRSWQEFNSALLCCK